MKGKLILVIMLLLTFIGQATQAVAMPCAEMEAGHHAMAAEMPMANMKVSNMANMEMQADSHGQNMADCCDPECECPMGGCVSASLVAAPQINTLALLSESISDLALMAISQPPNSPYYPPISS
ncbi:hypothetical protein SG34_002450 [Thalassomonas viridans]|uniref:CopL family metal-binding regulatory protein n=1 Tax=Thalassomonas viridans TaxID=137584 RepID=A0AAF0C7Y8_9GAMM|nr:hypothetical protein [Thalassomonas viridans]WDE05817.1 hypothetical protein SG34_002450 [Thalassomonas viridans]